MLTLSALTERCYIGPRSNNHSEQKTRGRDPGKGIGEAGREGLFFVKPTKETISCLSELGEDLILSRIFSRTGIVGDGRVGCTAPRFAC